MIGHCQGSDEEMEEEDEEEEDEGEEEKEESFSLPSRFHSSRNCAASNRSRSAAVRIPLSPVLLMQR